MQQPSTTSAGPWAQSPTDYSLAVVGPMVIGAILGLGGVQGGAAIVTLDVVRAAAVLPVILLGVTAAMIPALYIATSLSGAAPPARAVGLAVVRGFRAMGIALLGLAAPVAFLLATSTSHQIAPLLGAMVITAGVFAGLRVLFSDLFGRPFTPVTVRFVFTLWSAVSLAIGASMYDQFLVG